MFWSKIFVLTAILVVAHSGPIAWNAETNTECATSCPYESKFGWEPEKTYEYRYSGDTKTLLQGASEEHSSLHMTATVTLAVLTRCEVMLRLSDVDLQDSNPSNYERRSSVPMIGMFKRSLEQNGLRFGFKDGEIESVCPPVEEDAWIVNVKRGILSHLQNTMSDLDRSTSIDETDISGKCPVTYTPAGSGKIKKSKDILGCIGGHSYETVFKGVPYESASRIQNLPILKSTSECEQTLNDNKIISQVSCMETHTFRPFSKEESGAMTMVTSNLRLVNVRNGVSEQQGLVNSRSSLEYDNALSAHEMSAAVQETSQILRDICQVMTDDVRPEVPVLFGKLVKKMRLLDSQNLIQLHRGSKRMCDKANKFFRDAIPMLQSGSALSLLKELLQSRDISSTEAGVWLTSLALVPHPDLQLLQEAQSLLTITGEINRKAKLAISTIVHSYCQDHSDCDNERVVRQIIKSLEDSLNYNCNGDHDQVLLGLKSLGNAGRESQIVPVLIRCAQNTDAPMEVRVAAMKAFRRLPCSADRSEFKTIYSNAALDSELRINAFLEMMRCPSNDILQHVKEILENEDINQVGSFVWTYLTNLMETSDPHKQQIGDILANEDLSDRFNLDARKFSRNIEWSYFSHLLNAGATAESNIIWSEKSFIPRTANLNFTVELFGRAINLFEVEGRLENFDRLLEEYLGPKKEHNDLHQRQRRSLFFPEDALSAYDNSYMVQPEREAQASLSMKLLGNELRYSDFHAVSLTSLKDNANFLDLFIELAKNNQLEVTKSLMFLDSTMVVPTYMGLPLKLSAEGTTTMNIKVNGVFDIRRMFTWPSNINIDGSIVPSGAVEIQSEMGVDAHCARTGLKMVSTLHSSTILQGKIQLQDGSILNANIDLPKEKIEVLNAESKFLIHHRDEERVQRMLTDSVKEYKDCMDLTKALGVEACIDASIPMSESNDAPKVPFTGPVKLNVVLNKKDTHTGYAMELKFVQEKERRAVKSDLLSFAINTPGSRIDREISTSLLINRVDKAVTFNLKTPWKTVNFEGSVTNTDTQKGLSAIATIDQNQVYSFVFELPIAQQKNGMEYSPTITIQIPGMNPMKINARLFNNPGRKVEYELRLRNVLKDPASIKGDIIMINNQRRMRYQLSNEIESSFFKSSLSANVDYNRGQSMSNRLQFEYEFADGQKQSVTINNKLKDESTNTLTQYELTSQWTNSFVPRYNGDMNVDFTYGRNTLTTNLDAGFDKGSRIKLTQSGNVDLNGREKKIDGFVKLELPRGREYEMTVKHSNNLNELGSKITLKYGNNKEASIEANVLRQTSPLKISFDGTLKYPGREMKLSETIEEKDNGEYHLDTDCEYATGKHAIMKSIIKLRNRMEVSSDIELPSLQPIKLYGHLRPNFKNLESKAEVMYGSNKYAVEGNWNHGGNINAFTSRGNFQMEYPGRLVTASAEMSRRDAVISGSFETKWDASNDVDKKVSVTMNTNIALEKPSFFIKTEFYPRQFIEVNTKALYEPDNWMRSNSDLEASVGLKSSYEGFENINVEFKYDQSPSAVNSHAEATYNNKQFKGELIMRKNGDYSDTGMSIKITTPFRTYRTLGMSADYSIKNRQLDASVKVNWDNQEIAVVATGNGNIRRHQIDGTVTFNSPFTQPVEVRLEHKNVAQVFTTIINANWASRNNMKYEQIVTYDAGHKIAADIKFTSPFRGYEEITLTSNTMKERSTYSTNSELKWSQRQKIVFDGTFMLNGLTWEQSLRLTTPWRSFDRLMINSNNKNERGIWKTHGDIEFTGIEKVELDTEVGLATVKRVAFVFKCPPGDAGTTEFSAEFSGNPRQFTSGIEFNNDKILTDKIELRAEFDLTNIRDSKANLRYTSPVGLQYITLEMSHKKQGASYNTVATLEYPQYRGSFSNELTIQDYLNFNGKTEIEYLPGRRIEMVAQLNTRPNIDCQFSLKSPFHQDVLAKVTQQGRLQNFNSDAEFRYGSQAITAVVSFTAQRKTEGSLALTTPFRKLRTFNIKFDHEQTNSGFKSSAEVSWSPRDKITGSLEFGVGRGQTSGSIRITSPFEKVSLINGEFTTTGDLSNLQTTASFELNDKKVTLTNTFALSGSDFSISVDLETPIQGYRKIVGSYIHTGTLQQFNCNAKLKIGNSAERTFVISFASNPKIEVSFEVTQLNIAGYNNINGQFSHQSRNWRNFNAEGHVNIDGTRYNGNMEFKWLRKIFQLITSASSGNTDYGITIKHEGPVNNFNSEFTIDAGNREISAKAEMKLTGNTKEGMFELTTPMNGFRRTSLNFKLEGNNDYTGELTFDTPIFKLILNNRGSLRDFTVNLSLEHSSRTSTATLVYKYTDNEMQGQLTVNTPYSGYDKFAAGFKYEANRRSRSLSLSLETPYENFQKTEFEIGYKNARKFEGELKVVTSITGYENWNLEVDVDPREISGTVKLTTPIDRYDNFEIAFNYAGNARKFDAGVSVMTSVPSFRKLSIEVNHDFSNAPNLNSGIKVATSFPNFESMSASVSHQGNLNSFATSLDVTSSYPGYQTWKATLTHNKDQSGLKTVFTVQSPIEGYERFSVEVEYGKTSTGFNTKGVVETSVRGWEKFGVELNHEQRASSSFKSSLDVNTPFRRMRKWFGEIDHNGGLSRFTTVVKLNTPLTDEATVTLTHRGGTTDFTSTLNVEYGRRQNINTEVAFKTDGVLYDAKLKVTTPYALVKNLDLVAVHERTGSGRLDVTFNDNKMIDLDYAYNKQTPFHCTISINHPRPYEIKINYDQNGYSYSGDVDINLEGQRFGLDMNFKNQMENYNIEQEFSIAVSLPRGVYYKGSAAYSVTPNRFTHNLEVQWDRNDANKAKYEIELSSSGPRTRRNANGMVKVVSPWLNSETTITHQAISSKTYRTEVVIQGAQRITMTNELNLGIPIKNDFRLQHPSLRRDLELSVEGTVNYRIIEGKINARIERETLDFHGKITNQRQRKSIECHIDHPTTNLDMDFVAELINDDNSYIANSEFKWLEGQETQQTVYVAKADFDKAGKELKIEYSCPGRQVTWVGRKSISDDVRNIHRWDLVGTCSQMGEIKMEFGWSVPDKKVDALAEYNGDKIEIILNRQNAQNRKFEVYHETSGRRVQDVEVSAIAAGNGQVTGRTFFRPNMLSDLRQYFSRLESRPTINCFGQLGQVLARDLEQKGRVFQSRSVPVLKQALRAIGGAQLDMIKDAYNSMYRNNVFYVRDISDYIQQVRDIYREKINRFLNSAKENLNTIQDKMSAKADYWTNKMNRKMNALGETISAIREEYGPLLQDLNEVLEKITAKLVRFVNWIQTHPMVVRLQQMAERVERMDLLEPLRTLKERTMRKLQQFKNRYQQYFDIFTDIWGNLERRRELRNMNKWIQKLRDTIVWAWEHYGIQELVHSSARAVSDTSIDALRYQAIHEIKNRFKFDRNQIKSWDPENGNYEVEFYIPEDPFHGLHLPKMYFKENLMKLFDWVKEQMPKMRLSYHDILYKYRPSLDVRSWMPPFAGHASLAGTQHYYTFDHTFEEFAGECSYLLVRDFIDKGFSVVVHYDTSGGQIKKTLTVHDGDVKIDIIGDRVSIDGQQVELPQKTGHTSILMRGSEIRIDTDHGATVTCALVYDHCTVNVTGWYFGKTGGLFGTFDNEPATDFTKSDGSRTDNLVEFANSWSMGRRCNSANIAREVAVVEGNRRYDLCAKYFKDNHSPLSSCFDVVKPEAFMQMCMNDMGSSANRLETEKDTCKSTAFYVAECKWEGIPLSIPTPCVTCKDPQGNEFSQGATVTLEDNRVPKSADVLFVVQHCSGNQEVFPKLTEVADDLNQALAAKQLNGNNFGMVSYGGAGSFSAPHSHTFGGKIMNTIDEFKRAMSPQKISDLEMDIGEYGDALPALHFAAKYPFRTGVSKTVIFIPCDSCKEGRVRYHEIKQLFDDRDIVLHMLLTHEFKLKYGERNTMIFGVDQDGVFTHKHLTGNDLESDKDFYNLVVLPKDICAALVDETDGATFSKGYFLDSRRDTQKKFLEVMVRVQADRGEPTECQKCQCIPGDDGVGQSVCRDCYRRTCTYCLYAKLFGDDSGEDDSEQTPVIPNRNTDRGRRPGRRRPNRRQN